MYVVLCLVTQSCLTLCNSMDCSPPGSSIHETLQARVGVGCHFLLQGVFPTQGLNACLLHCRQIFTTVPPGKSSFILALPLKKMYGTHNH